MPARKPVEARKRHGEKSRTSTELAKPADGTFGVFEEMPNPPRNLVGVVKMMWEDFWTSDLAQFVRKTDLPALRRLWGMYDELERTRIALYTEPPPRPERGAAEPHNDFMMRQREWRILTAAQGRLTASPRGGVQLNPLLAHQARLESQITALEDRFGLNLRSRMDLGLTVLKAESLAEQNANQLEAFRKQMEGQNGHANTGTDADPRAALLVAGSDGRRKAAS